MRGVKTGAGARNDATSATFAEVAKQAGVSERTARNRAALARQLAAYPETAAKVDAGEVTVSGALWEAQQEARRKGIEPLLRIGSTTLGEALQKAVDSGTPLTVPPKSLLVSQKVASTLSNDIRWITKYDPEDVASVFDPQRDAGRYEEEMHTIGSILAWLERYEAALLAMRRRSMTR